MAASLFARQPRRSDERQLSLHLPMPFAAARAVGDRRADQAQRRAERADPTFGDRAYGFLADYVQQQGDRGTYSGESLVDAMKLAGICPPDDRAFGSIFAKAIRQKLIRVVGHCPRTKGHGTAGGRVYSRGGAA